MRVSGDGTHVYVSGTSWGGDPATGGTSDDIETIAYDPNGHVLWSRRYNGPGNTADDAVAEAVGPGRVYVTGFSETADHVAEFVTVAYASTGTFLWAKNFDDPGTAFDAASGIAVAGNSIVVVGTLGTRRRNLSDETLAYAPDGTLLWSTPLRVGPNPPFCGYVFLCDPSIAASPGGGRVFVAAQRRDAGFVTAAYRASTGASLWIRATETKGWQQSAPAAIAASPNGRRVYVTGTGCTPQCFADEDVRWEHYAAITVAYAGRGVKKWTRLIRGDGTQAVGVAVSPDSRTVYVAGNVGAEDTCQCFLAVAYLAADGATRWSNATRAGTAEALAVGPGDERVFVTGENYVCPGGHCNFFDRTLSFSTTGQLMWDRSTRTPGAAQAIAVGPAGRQLYVTGSTGVFSRNEDFLTVAYSTS